ncbi:MULTISPECIES: hypothetical protein [unclassified Janthinobacterium]|uniref:hypothetical protein n=1 Tax=unclassified Janthinobacterium TaxID=2610881 RepID=UPI0016200F97|nr:MULTISPECIES: hypothetical protein [unclassified Janthinobacterium]MBB5609715.1 hypothetical protein [Janthinobacterium sp. S3T4]MBB5614887.1 hypothetical protein [Janthinobacterium sp. S3M3]
MNTQLSSIKRRSALALLVLACAALAGSAAAAPGGHGGGFHGGGFHGGGFHGAYHGGGHFHGGGHVGVGVWLGAPWGYGYGPGWYGDPWYNYPYTGTIVVQQQPPVYVEQGGTQAAPAAYYCDNPQGYYPDVKSCSVPWRQVAPTNGAPGSVAP